MFKGAPRILMLSVVVTVAGAGCEPGPGPNDAERQELHRSQTTWAALKATSSGAYRYTNLFQSWTGYTSTIIVEVRNDHVASVDFTSDDGAGKVTSWTEQGAEVGTHGGGIPLTVEGAYAECEATVLTRDPKTNEIVLHFDKGILTACTYRPYDCADDCIFGPRIGSLELL